MGFSALQHPGSGWRNSRAQSSAGSAMERKAEDDASRDMGVFRNRADWEKHLKEVKENAVAEAEKKADDEHLECCVLGCTDVRIKYSDTAR